ncbi:MAG: radical SAM protein, partial [Candidatus Lokiarchaeota archaeon]|nr:radical SAM protein [Candidatus Lokiarchaeota archaeon]
IDVNHAHLGLGYLASYLRKHKIPTDIIDADFFNYTDDKIIEIIKEDKPDFLGFTSTAFTIKNVYYIIKKIKNINNPPVIVLGGHHATFAAEEILKENKFIDYIVYGEGEKTFTELIQIIAENEEPTELKGLYYSNKENIIKKTAPRKLISDLDSFPYPARDPLDYCLDKDKDFILNIISSRGCPGKCSFCSVSQFYDNSNGPIWRGRSPKDFVDEIEILIERYGNSLIDISDDNFIGFKRNGKQRVTEICREILDRDLKIKFTFSSRADLFNKNDNNFIRLLKRAGLVSIRLGFESGSQNILELYNKNISVKRIIQTYNLFQKNNVSCTQGNFIMFNPYTTIEDLKKNIKLFFRLDQILYYELSSILYLFPGISLMKKLKRDGLLRDDYNHTKPLAYDFIDPKIEIMANYLYKNRKSFADIDSTFGKLDSILNIYDFDFLPLLNSEYKEIYKNKRKQILELRTQTQYSIKNLLEACIRLLEKTDLRDQDIIINGFDEIKMKILKSCGEKTTIINNKMDEIFLLITDHFQS